MEDLLIIGSRVLGVFLVMFAGAFCRRMHWLTEESDRSLANLTANLLLPALFFERVVMGDSVQSLGAAWVPILAGFLTTSIGFILGYVFAITCGPWIGLHNVARQSAFALCVGICNYGYIPLPLAQQFYPQAEVTLIIHNVGVDVSMWSVGVLIVAGRSQTRIRRLLTSPPLLAVFIAVLMRQLGAQSWLPQPLLYTSKALGGCAIPLGLLLSGAIMVDYLPRLRLRESGRVFGAAIVLRLAIFPMLMLLATQLLVRDILLQQVMLLQAAMPAAMFPIVLVRLYDQDVPTAVQVVACTTLVALLTIPLWLAGGGMWLGLPMLSE